MHLSLNPLNVFLTFVISVICCACTTTTQQPAHPNDLSFQPLVFHVPEVERVNLDSGISLYLREDNELPLIQLTAMIGSGALAASIDKAGFDELFAGSWRTGGTRQRTPADLEKQIDFLAANLGAQMGPYFTQIDLSLRAQDLREGLSIFADLLKDPGFAQESFELEQIKAQERVRRQNDNPGSVARRLLSAALYPHHYLGQSPTIQSIASVTRDDLINFHRTFFAPNNLSLAVSGDFDRKELIALLEQAFEGWPKQTVPNISVDGIITEQVGGVQVVDRPIPQTTVLVGGLGLTKDHPDQYAARVLNYILGGGSFNSRMMKEIRSNRGLAYSAYSFLQVGRRLPGLFVAGTETQNGKVVEVLGLIHEIMTSLRENPVSDAELQLAKESQINSFVFGFDDSHAIVVQQMHLDFFNYPDDYLSNYRNRISEVTAQDVQRIANELIRFQEQQVILVGDSAPYFEQLNRLNLPVKRVTPDGLE
ncbi:MAG: insulinase family protein [Deltaproteobacteria bacterium]|jgi:zinc protease|nr:insulinase family protein [Deltaproteobacteria bacterium]MBW2518970.1 insulinase family protein [Deltaproteobacteria bacterium]